MTCRVPTLVQLLRGSAFLVLWALAGLAPAGAAEIKLVALNFPPYIFEDGGKPAGLAVDLVTEAMHRAGNTISVQVLPWARALDEAKTGQADGIFTAYKTPEREGFLTYSNQVVVQQVVSLFVKKGAALKFDGDLAKLKTSRVGVVNQISYGSKIDQAIKSGLWSQLDKSNDTDNNVKKLVSGRFDFMPSNRYVALYIAKKLGLTDQISELAPPVESIPSYIAFTKARDLTKLRDQFDTALAAMRQDGTYQKILDRYSR